MIRKIISKQDEGKKKRRNQIIVGLVLVFLMLISILGYSFGSDSNSNTTPTIKYNGYEFTNTGGYWNLDIGGTVFSFISNPSNTYKLNSSLKSVTSYYGKILYLYSENPDAESEIYRNLYLVSQSIINACPENEENCDVSLPRKTCGDNFIIIIEENETNVFQEDGCVFIEGAREDLIRITDGFLLKILGVQ